MMASGAWLGTALHREDRLSLNSVQILYNPCTGFRVALHLKDRRSSS